ncbi:MAG: NAD-dependent DNA ligase LigA [Bacteroidaceae bacterium]|nr:NAD-dependent DNA ligase LigA [Bacteroidaceae bacterium]
MNDQEQILALRNELHQHNYNYYVKNAPTITDREFDEKMHLLMQLEERHPEFYDANSPSQRVGSDLNHEFTQVRHRYPMLSLANTYNRDDVQAFYDRVSQGLGGEAFEVCCELKFDGLSISLIYEHGQLVRAVTRGDGEQGDDVTANVKTIRSIPLVLHGGDWPDSFEIRGEVLMPWQSFEDLNRQREQAEEPLFANPRNAASGTLKSKNSAVVAQRKLDAYFYYLLGTELPTDNHYDNLQRVASWGFKVSEAMRTVGTLEEVMNYIDYWDHERSHLPVATDGIVLKVNSVEQQQRLGYTAKTPRWAIAYKFQAERALTRLNEVTYQVGRTGAITPVANMEPVLLSGTIVKRASLHNEDYIRALDLHVGDMVYVEKAGEIIPQVVGKETDGSGISVSFPDTCPECGTPLVRYEGEAAHYCPNDSACPPQIKGRIEHFISRDAMNIDSLGPETVADYYERGLIHNVADLYELTVADITGGNASRERSAQRVVDGISSSKLVPFERVLYALGIRFVGKVTAKQIARHFGSLDALLAALPLEGELEGVSGVGEVIAQSVRAYFAQAANMEIVNRLRNYGLQMEIVKSQEPGAENQVLAGQSIVISGTFAHHSREEYKEIIESCGGKNVSSISSKTSFILAGDNMGPSKQEKAQQLGIPLVSEAEFLDIIGETDPPSAPSSMEGSARGDAQKGADNSAPQQLTLFD